MGGSNKNDDAGEGDKTRRLVSSGSAFEAQIGYSRAVVTGDWVFVSGCTGYDYATGAISPDPVRQAEQTMRNVAAALHSAGSSADEVVRVRYMVPRREDFPLMWPVLRRWFGDGHDHTHDHGNGNGGEGEEKKEEEKEEEGKKRKGPRPAATMISCGLMEEVMKIEIEVTARKGSAFLSTGSGEDEEVLEL